ncbi:hypothetical protein GYMLUDRAFT_38475 [Collybiopsis luxurians FD-317 M1]|nr:hypothetical protein GYMLUDRAFT_38475 [Collybiopsis luxurians FD-317 M1]
MLTNQSTAKTEIVDLYDIALLLNYERASTEPRFRHCKLREVASSDSDFRTVLITSPVYWSDHKGGSKDGFVFEKADPHERSEGDPDLPSNMLPLHILSHASGNIKDLSPQRLETIYWQARGHDGCFMSATILQYFFDLFPRSNPPIRVRFANGTEFLTPAERRTIEEFDLVKLKHLTLAMVFPQNWTYITGSENQPEFRHAVVAFPSPVDDVWAVLDLASMQFGDSGRGPGRKGKGTFVLESMDQYFNRLKSGIADNVKMVQTSFAITAHSDPAIDAWLKDVAKRVKERWDKRKEHHWCGHCGRPLANGPLSMQECILLR